MKFVIYLLIIITSFSATLQYKDDADTCEYSACPTLDKNKINVHLVPHSHDDVGWLKTVEQYFSGVAADVGVNYIISSVLGSLKHNSARKFTQVETAFFSKWWQIQTEEVKNDYRNLVENGQIEIANGGWVMNDEACVNYHSTIDQFTKGLKFINDTLGPCGRPRTGWQIDPFGHSRTQAFIYNQMGFDGAFVSRLDFREREQRMGNRSVDFAWRSSSSVESSDIFYNYLMNHYGSPTGFCFDFMCNDDAINDDPESFDYNADRKLTEFEQILKDFALSYSGNNIFIPMGGDFNYQLAEQHFINMDRLIKLFNNHSTYNVFYSTPACYVKAAKELLMLAVKTDDFFPYSSEEYAYWTGYFTSRPNSKRLERTAHNILQANKQLRSIFKMSLPNLTRFDSDPDVASLEESVANMQHHDAITGTEKQLVADYYGRNIMAGIKKAEDGIGSIISNLLSNAAGVAQTWNMSSCLLTNISVCETSKKDQFIVAVYNPLSKSVSSYVRLPVSNSSFSIAGPNNETVYYDVVGTISNFSYISLEGTEPAACELVFSADDVPPMGINLYVVQKQDTLENDRSLREAPLADIVLGTQSLNVVLDPSSLSLKSATMNNITLNITQGFYYYDSENGQHNTWASGAYLFRPVKGSRAVKVSEDNAVLEYSFNGTLVDEACVKINDWIKQIVRVYKGKEPYVEFDWLLGPIPVNETSYEGKEVVTRFDIENFNNNGIFYTDSNGREMIKRFRNRRQDYSYDSTIEPVTSNYYPVTSRMVMKDDTSGLEVAILNDRSQGGSSLDDGQMELMIHRRLLADDSKGVGEALNEQEFGQGMVVRGTHILLFGNSTYNYNESIIFQERDKQLRQLSAPYVLLADATNTHLKDIINSTDFQFNFVSNYLPDNVNILTLEKWREEEESYLMRLEHLYEKKEHAEFSHFVLIDLSMLFLKHQIKTIRETTLDGNQWKDEYVSGPYNVTLGPMEIRTFVITVEDK